MDIKDRKISKRYGFSRIPISHPNFLEQLEEHIAPSVLLLLSKGYTTVSSCHGHGLGKRPYVVIDKKSNMKDFDKLVDNFFIEATEQNNKWIFHSKGNLHLFFTKKFICKQIEKAVSNLPINTV
jgi:hypothetical protein